MSAWTHVNVEDSRHLTPAQEQTIIESGCCMGVAVYGPHRCTCWEPVYDLDQADVVAAEPTARRDMCTDCAYRPDSPERNGDPHQRCSGPGELDALARASTFWCHQGMRRLVGWRHPSLGFVVTSPGVAYGPPEVDRVPYKADGTPAERCAGWAARRRQLEGTSS